MRINVREYATRNAINYYGKQITKEESRRIISSLKSMINRFKKY